MFLVLAVSLLIALLMASGGLAAAPRADAEIVSLQPNLPSGQVVGTPVTWTVQCSGGVCEDGWRYRYSVSRNAGPSSIIRDFIPERTVVWSTLEDGLYTVKVEAIDEAGAAVDSGSVEYRIRSRLAGTEPLVSSTGHPLVLLYSAPPCVLGKTRVQYRAVGDTNWSVTPWKQCRSGVSQNFYVGGLLAETEYELRHERLSLGVSQTSQTRRRKTGAIDVDVVPFAVTDPVDEATSTAEPLLLYSLSTGPFSLRYPAATDLQGRVRWYYSFRWQDNPTYPWSLAAYLLRPTPGGGFLMVLNYAGEWDRVLREIDLTGEPVRETNTEALGRQLLARGEHDPIGSVNHDALRLPNGHTLVLVSVERLLVNEQGSGAVDVLSDMVLDLDENFQIVWTWNGFDHMDHSRTAILGETCSNVTPGCAPFFLATNANDWTHANTIEYVPRDGSLILSLRNQDWIIKINYADGHGDGRVLWRLGAEGDFRMTPVDDPDLWFSHQHEARYYDGELVLFDNGNTRCAGEPLSCESRGQAWVIDEQAMTARRVFNRDLDNYSFVFGSAQRLANGNYHFMSGLLLSRDTLMVSRSIEFQSDGKITYAQEAPGMATYRVYRMVDIYTPPGQYEQATLPSSDRQYLPLAGR